nr:stress protein DDR48-like [Megalopta genalis]
MAKIISLKAVIFGSILLVRAEPPVTSYSITGDNAFEYNSNIIKDGHRENTDFYSAGTSGQSLSNGRSQPSLEDSLRGSSYSGFSQNAHNPGYQGFSSNARDSLGASSYFMNDPIQSSFESYTNANNNNNNNGDSTFSGYAQSMDQAGSEFNQAMSFSSGKHKSPEYMRFSDNLPGATSTGSFPGLTSESSSFRDYSADAFRGHTTATGGYMDGDQTFTREPSSLLNSPSTDYSYGKHKESVFGAGSGKYANDVYSLHPENRYVRGSHGNGARDYVSPMYLPMSAGSSTLLNNLRGTSDLSQYGTASTANTGKYSKYNKYLGDYALNAGYNYLSKEPEPDYSFGNYGNYGNYGKGKTTAFKDSRPSSYNAQAYLGDRAPSYPTKTAVSYKGKPGYISYSGSSSAAYATMPSLHGTYNSNSYTDSPILRRYRSSSGHVPGHGTIYSGYY